METNLEAILAFIILGLGIFILVQEMRMSELRSVLNIATNNNCSEWADYSKHLLFYGLLYKRAIRVIHKKRDLENEIFERLKDEYPDIKYVNYKQLVDEYSDHDTFKDAFIELTYQPLAKLKLLKEHYEIELRKFEKITRS